MVDPQLKVLKELPQEVCSDAQSTNNEGAAPYTAQNSVDDEQALLAALQQKVTQQTNVLAQQKAQVEAFRIEHSTVQEMLREREQRLALQSKKINGLLMECERLGAERELLRSLERRLLHISSNPHAALAQLLAYQSFVQSSLGNDLQQAETYLQQLLYYKKEMCAPTHRAVHFLARRTGHTWLGRLASNLMHVLYALRSSRQQR